MSVPTVTKARIVRAFTKVFPHKNFDKRMKVMLALLFPPAKKKAA
jgi:hypothetical protein